MPSALRNDDSPSQRCQRDHLAILLTPMGSVGSGILLPLELQREESVQWSLHDYLTAENPGRCGKSACSLEMSHLLPLLLPWPGDGSQQPVIPSQSARILTSRVLGPPATAAGTRHMSTAAILKPFQPFPQNRPDALPCSSGPVPRLPGPAVRPAVPFPPDEERLREGSSGDRIGLWFVFAPHLYICHM